MLQEAWRLTLSGTLFTFELTQETNSQSVMESRIQKLTLDSNTQIFLSTQKTHSSVRKQDEGMSLKFIMLPCLKTERIYKPQLKHSDLSQMYHMKSQLSSTLSRCRMLLFHKNKQNRHLFMKHTYLN